MDKIKTKKQLLRRLKEIGKANLEAESAFILELHEALEEGNDEIKNEELQEYLSEVSGELYGMTETLDELISSIEDYIREIEEE